MPTKQMKIDFYRVEMPPEFGGTFARLLQQISTMPLDDSRNAQAIGSNREDRIRLQEASSSHQRWEGDMIRIRMDELPLVASLDGKTEPVDLEDDEGIGEETAFRYHSGLRVLALQRNRTGVSAYAFARYFELMGELDETIILEPVLELDTLNRLNAIHDVTKFEIRFAGLRNIGEIFQGQDATIKQFITVADQFRAPTMTVTLSMGHARDGFLATSKVKRVARALRRLVSSDRGAVKRIEISGHSDTDEKDVIDLLKDRMIEIRDVELDADRRVPYGSRLSALRDACRSRQQELRRMFGDESD